jgi:hypothetical protein
MLTLPRSPAETARPTNNRDTMFERCVNGALAGLIATAPMTWTMRAASQWLPWHASRRLPPRQITEATLEHAGVDGQAPGEQLDALATLAHYGYGAAGGAALATLLDKSPLSRPATGALVGLAIWAGSYLGWLPATGVRRSALRDHKERSAQMIAAHLVWGATAAALVDTLSVEDRRDG